jgi:hypothetical protein
MFDLEEAIADWREQMLAAGIKAPVPLDELELHLREEIERQMEAGMNGQAAFKLALQQLGHPWAVRDEFKKAEAATAAARAWKQKQSLLLAITGLISLYDCAVLLFRLGDFSEATPGQQISGFAAVAAFNLFLWGGRWILSILPVVRVRRTREAISISACALLILWGVLFMRVILPRQELTMSQLFVVLLWGFFPPAGIGIGLLWGLGNAAGKRASPADA